MKKRDPGKDSIETKTDFESELNDILEKIQISRNNLNSLIEREDKLCNSEIMKVSRTLDELLNEYEKLIEKNKQILKD